MAIKHDNPKATYFFSFFYFNIKISPCIMVCIFRTYDFIYKYNTIYNMCQRLHIL